MAKVPFTKLKCKINTEEIPVQIGEETIAVKQYLPIQNKLELIENVIILAHEQDANYSNPVKANVYRDLEVVFAYTNISFTEKQKEDTPKLYDMLKSSGMLQQIINAIPVEEYQAIIEGVNITIESFYKYQSSAVGIIDQLKNKTDDLNIDIDKLIKSVEDPEALGMLKSIIEEIL